MRSPALVHLAKLCLLGLVALGVAAEARAAADPFTVTFFNLRWFGLQSDATGQQLVESRVPTIRAFLTAQNAWADVMIFEEIVDVALLERGILENRYECESYDHTDPRHQHVVVCAGNGFRLGLAPDDDNYTYEEVAMGQKRPAVHAMVTDRSGQEVAHVIGVHLKASPEHSAMRLEQVGMVVEHLKDRRSTVPVIFAGDVNTYADDSARFDQAFGAPGVGLTQVPIGGTATFRSPTYMDRPSLFDRAWVSGLRALGPARVSGPCNGTVTRTALQKYYDEVSDHCAVTIRFQR